MVFRSVVAALLLWFVPCIGSTVLAVSQPHLIELDTHQIAEHKPAYVSERHGLSIRPELLSQGGGTARLIDQREFAFLPDDIERRGEGRFTWRGRIRDAVGEMGSATLTVHDNHIRGTLILDRVRYQLSTGSRGEYWLDRIDPGSIPEMHPPGWPKVPEGEPAHLPETPPVLADDDEPPVTDVIVFYTRSAINFYNDEADMRLAIRNAVDNNNTALINSEVDGRVRLVGVFPTEYEETGTGSNALGYGRSNGHIQGLRNDYSADLVAMITSDTDVCGVAWLLTSYNPNWGFGVSMTSATPGCLGGQTFAHELGHNMGLHHDPANASAPGSLIEPFAYGHFMDQEFRTIMSYSNQCSTHWTCPRIDHFSSPDVDDPSSGLPTGTADRNNAEVLRRSMPYVAQWRQQPAGFEEALGEPVAEYAVGGDNPWVVQDRITYQGGPAALSGPAFTSENSLLEMSNLEPAAHDMGFRARATVDDSDGELRVYADSELLEAFSELPNEWVMQTVSVPEDTETVRWVWRAADSTASPESVGMVLLSGIDRGEMGEKALSGQVVNAVGDPVESVEVVARNSVGDALNRFVPSDDAGSFQFSVSHLADYPPEVLQLSGLGVVEDTISLEFHDCNEANGSCELTVVGEPRMIGGNVEGLLDGESVTVTLMENHEVLTQTVTADSQGIAGFSFDADALFEYGSITVDATGYSLGSDPIDGVSVRESDAMDMAISLSTQAPVLLAVDSNAEKQSISVTVTLDAGERESTVTLTKGSGENATVLTETVVPDGPGEQSVSFELSGLDCNATYEFDIEVVNDHEQSDVSSESASTADCSGSGGDSGGDADSDSGSSCSLNPGARPDPLLGLLLLLAFAGLLRRRGFES